MLLALLLGRHLGYPPESASDLPHGGMPLAHMLTQSPFFPLPNHSFNDASLYQFIKVLYIQNIKYPLVNPL